MELKNKKEYIESNFFHPSLMGSSTTKGFLLGAGLVVLLVLAFIAGGYFYNPTQTPVTQKPADAITNTPSATPASSDKRQFISTLTNYTQEHIVKTFLSEEWNTDASTATAIFSSKEQGIEIVLPWNQAWGTKNYQVEPYEITEIANKITGVYFGHAGVCGEGAGCLYRAYRLNFTPAKTLNEEVKQYEGTTTTTKTFTVGKFSVIEAYDEPGLCSTVTLTVIGKKSNYTFTGPCRLSDENITELKKIIATIKFI